MSIRSRKHWLILSLAAVGLMIGPVASFAQTKTQILTCAKRSGKAFKRFAGDALEILGDCQVNSLKDDERTDCAADEDVLEDLDKAADKLRREARKCDDDALRALCPHGQREDTTLKEFVLNAEGGTTDLLRAVDANVFTTSYGGCPRPLGEISRDAEECAEDLAAITTEAIDDFLKCVVKCELNGMRKSGEEPCFDDLSGAPLDEKILDCSDRVLEDIGDVINRENNNNCTDAALIELGCPFGFTTASDIIEPMRDRILDETKTMTDGIFFSECGDSGGSGSEGGPTEPAAATLLPSETQTEINCGQDLDAAFFGSDDTVRLDADLDCSPAGLGSIGIIISASNVTLDARTDYDLTGPSRSSNRTGTGILVAPGAKNVRITRFSKIQRYAVGIGDSGDNDGLRIEDSTVRRNRVAGIRTTSPDVTIDNVKSDRNAIGFDVSGDDSTLIDCRALRSEPFPNIGILVHGVDTDGDGEIVRINRCEAEGNTVGIIVQGGPHLLEDNDVRFNNGDGMQIASVGSKVESNSIKLNSGNGMVVSGDANNITANRSDENGADGFVITGIANDVNNNQGGSLTDQGNFGRGFWFNGLDTNVESNTAEANVSHGFQIDEDTADVQSNTAKENGANGFQVNSAGNNLDTNRSEDNVGFQFSIAPGNVDDSGNTADGSTITFGAGGGDF